MKSVKSIAAMCALSLTLVACGGNAPATTDTASNTEAQATQDAESTTTETKAEETKAETKQDASAVGTWKSAAFKSNGITMTGDIAQFANFFGGDDAEQAYNMTLDLKAGDTGTISLADESHELAWSQSGNVITITRTDSDTESDDEADSFEAKGTIEDGALFLQLDKDEDMTLIMTPDGTYSNAKSYDKTKAKPITSEDALIGTWKLTDVCMAGITMSGDGNALAEQFSYDDSTITFTAGGKVNMFGDDNTYTVSADGATVTDGTISAADLLMLDDNLIVDMSSLMGVDIFMVLAK